MSAVLGLCVALLIVWTATLLRNDARVRELTPPRVKADENSGLLVRGGALLRRALRFLPPVRNAEPSIAGDRNLALVSLAFVVLVFVFPLGALALLAVALCRPVLRTRAQRLARERRIGRDIAVVTDLYRLAVASGLNITMATRAVAGRLDGPIAEELDRATVDIARGRRVADALEDVVPRTSELVRPLVSALTSSERYGAPLSVVLERLARESRVDQERRAEQAAQRLSIQLLFPVAGCTLPAFALLTVAPLLAGGFGSLALPFH